MNYLHLRIIVLGRPQIKMHGKKSNQWQFKKNIMSKIFLFKYAPLHYNRVFDIQIKYFE